MRAAEPDATAAFFGGFAGCKQVGRQLRRKPRSFVSHFAQNLFAAFRQRKSHGAACQRRLQRVLGKVHQDQGDQVGRPVGQDRFTVHLGEKADTPLDRERTNLGRDDFHQFRQRDFISGGALFFAKNVDDLVDQTLHSARGGDGLRPIRFGRLRVRG